MNYELHLRSITNEKMKNNLLVLLSLSLMIPTSFAARCADFSSQREAQSYMHQTGARYLDRDRDG